MKVLCNVSNVTKRLSIFNNNEKKIDGKPKESKEAFLVTTKTIALGLCANNWEGCALHPLIWQFETLRGGCHNFITDIDT